MKIRRIGSSRRVDYTSIEFTRQTISFDPKDGLVHVTSNYVQDFSADARHDYDVSISISELEAMLAKALQAVPEGGT